MTRLTTVYFPTSLSSWDTNFAFFEDGSRLIIIWHIYCLRGGQVYEEIVTNTRGIFLSIEIAFA